MTRISRTKAAELIKSNTKNFFSATFIKENKELRTFNCIFKKATDLGYFLVIVRKEGIKNLNIKTLVELKINKTHYKIV